MRKVKPIAAAIGLVGSVGVAAWLQWFAGGVGTPEEIQQQLLGEWYWYEQGDFGPMHATEYLETYTFVDTSNRVKLADGSDDLVRDVNVAAYIDNAPDFMKTATIVSRISGTNLRQIHTIDTTYEVYGDQVAINMGREGARLLTIRELSPSRIVWVENNNERTVVRKDVYDSAPKEDLANIFNVAVSEERGEQ